ncbi:MAG: hypothetical protein PUF17_10520 [Lactimicrobium massiliense]|nr:hypothetical protein [Lactimicrobium massiliense]MDD6561379.1 hypothetical protein [Lactimicrobium massiliense]
MSDISQAAAAVWEKFIQLEQSDSAAKKMLQKINSGAATYEDLQTFSNWMSTNIVKLASESFPEDSQAVLDTLNDMSVCRNYFSHIDEAIKRVQKSMNEAAGIGLQPVSMNHPRQLMDATTSASDNYAADIQKFSQALIDTSQKHVDLAELKNARFQAGAGCEVTVTRKYDHVGLRNRKQACAWCLARVGTDVPYKEAVARGMFERHEGCGCTIIYHSEKGTTVQRKAGGRESWDQMSTKKFRISDERQIITTKNSKYQNIYCQTGSVDSQRTAEQVNQILSEMFPDSDVDEIVIAKKNILGGIAAYDTTNNRFFLSEELSNPNTFRKIVNEDYFPARNLKDVITHEIGGHKKHWDSVKAYYSQHSEEYSDVLDSKVGLESELHKYVNEKAFANPLWIKNTVSENASISFYGNTSNDLNELIADATVLKNQNKLTDRQLWDLIEEVVSYDGKSK